MKNTVKKILALVFAVVMVCSLAVPAFAAETFDVNIIVVDNDTKTDDIKATASKLTDGVTLKKALEKVESKTLDFVFKSGKLVEVNGIKSGVKYFETDGWYVTVNGKLITEDLSTVTLAKNDVVVVYWSDVVLNTKVAKVDTSAINTGIVSFYYYDANGAKQPLTNADVAITGVENKLADDGKFVTDEKGQIWFAPEYLDEAATYTITNVDIAEAKTSLKSTDDNYEKEVEYFDTYGSLNIVTVLVDDQVITVKADMYETAGATGDMTMVYVLVAAAAVVTLAAVVVMKKKSVKAN
jgi:hypothetical protein